MVKGSHHRFLEPKPNRWLLIAGTVAFSIANLLYFAKRASPQGAQGQPLSLSQVEGLIQVPTPDATIAAEIRRRGLNFAPSKETVETLRRVGAGPETLQAIDELRPMLDEAKQAIPAVLTKIYQALDQGNAQALRPLASPQAARNTQMLYMICPPSIYRAHYVEAILERPGQKFDARVHVLFQPFDEKVYVLAFNLYQGNFLLIGMSPITDDWFGPAKEAAIQLARNFIYAAKAHQADVLTGLVAPGLDVSQYTANACWREAFQSVIEIGEAYAVLDSHKGLKIRVHATVVVKGSSASTTEEHVDFWVDRVHDQYKIVAANPLYDLALDYSAPDACRGLERSLFAPVEAPHLVDDTLRRFGLPTSSIQPYKPFQNPMEPVELFNQTPANRDDRLGLEAKSFIFDKTVPLGPAKP